MNNHHPPQETLALYSTADLDAPELKSIAEHVALCEACRDCIAEFEQVARLLTGLAGEPSTEDLQEVRRRVLVALDKNRKRHRYLEWAAAAPVIAVAALLLPHKHQVPVQPPTMPVLRVPAPPAVLAQEVPIARHKIRRPSAGLRSVALIARAGEEPSIKIMTADPSVVILLPPDSRDDERTQSNDE
jgi:hypothetical protein